jgi:hypothetical protein
MNGGMAAYLHLKINQLKPVLYDFAVKYTKK